MRGYPLFPVRLAHAHALVVASAVIGLVAFELAARVLLGPPAVHFLTRGGPDRQTDFNVTYGLDRYSRRATACPPGPHPRRTVAIIGDSFAFGGGVRDDEHFASRLGCLMPGAEILNFGSVGQGFLYYDLAARSFIGPGVDDIVLLLYEDDLPPADWDTLPSKVERSLYRVSHAAQVLRKAKQAIVRELHRADYESSAGDGTRAALRTNRTLFENMARPPADRLDLFDRVLRHLIADVRTGAPQGRVFIAVVPEASTLSPAHGEFYRSVADVPLPPLGRPSALYRRAQEACGAVAGCRFIDLYPLLSGEGAAYYFPHDLHWNAAGHARVADAMLAVLVAAAP